MDDLEGLQKVSFSVAVRSMWRRRVSVLAAPPRGAPRARAVARLRMDVTAALLGDVSLPPPEHPPAAHPEPAHRPDARLGASDSDAGSGPLAARAVPAAEIDVGLDDVVGVDIVRRRGRPLAQPVPRPQFARPDGRHAASRPPVRRASRARARRTWRRPWRAKPAFRSSSSRRRRSSRCTTARRTARSVRTSRRCAGRARRGRRHRVHRGDRRHRRRPGSGMSSTGREGTGGVVNELLVQMQSFDEPTTGDASRGGSSSALERCCPAT